MSKNTLWAIWSNKVEDIGFIHQFFVEEIIIYKHILFKNPQKLTGRLKDMAKSFNVSTESFFGFLLGIRPLIKHDLKNLKHRDLINIEIDLHALHRHFRQNLNYAHLLELDGWENASEKAEDPDVTATISVPLADNSIRKEKRTLWSRWKNRVQDVNFIHEFFMDEVVIYHWILSQKKPILVGSISELAKYFDVSEEALFGFLQGIAPFIKHDPKRLKNNDHIDIELDPRRLREHLTLKSDCAHLLDLEGWADVDEKTDADEVESKKPVRDVDGKIRKETAIEATAPDVHKKSIISDTPPHFDALKEHVFNEPILSGIHAKLASSYTRSDYIVFLSLCNAAERATVLKGVGHNLESAWAKAEKSARNFIAIKNFDLVWAKVDIVCSTEEIPTKNLSQEMADSSFPFFLRKGVAFDRNFNLAFLEGELNGSRLYHYYTMKQFQNKEMDHNSQRLNHNAINDYLSASASAPLKSLPEVITTFTTIGFFCDNEVKIYDLYEGCGIDAGRRAIDETDATQAMKAMTSVSKSLNRLIEQDGKFAYSYNPITGTKGYSDNILRHTDSVLSLIRGYRVSRDQSLVASIEAGIGHLVNSAIIYKNQIIAFVLDKQTDEIKLGGNGLAVIMLIEYMGCFETDRFIDTIRHLANGILEMQDKITGMYYHVLNSDFSLKEKFRTIYYDGEATYALARMYTFTKDRKYLDAAASSTEDFIARKYSKYMEHQVVNSLNEITKYISEPRYYEFALRNAVENLDEFIKRPRVHITFLPLLMAVWQIYDRLMKRGIQVEYANKLDVRRFAETIYKMATHLLNAYFYPEYAMYMKTPEKCVGSVFRREGGFQEKIDDIQFFLEGYHMYHSHYDSIRSHLSKDFIQTVSRSNLIFSKGEEIHDTSEAFAMKQAIPEKEPDSVIFVDNEISLLESGNKITAANLIQIGFLSESKFVHPQRKFFETNVYYKMLFHIAPHYGLQLVLFSPHDVDFEAGTVQGTVLVNGEPEKCTTEIPRVIDNSLRANNKIKGFGDKIEARAYMIRKSGSNRKRKKHDIYNMLLRDGKYVDLLIPTKAVKSLEDITSMNGKEGIVIKKIDSHQGRSVIHISRVGSRYRLILGREHYDLTKSKLSDYYEQNIQGEKYILQPFIKSATRYGEPFDVRLQARRIDDENFFVNPYVRVGSPEGIISNYAGGGYTLPFDAFLRANFDEDEQRDMKSQIMRLGNEFPKYYSNLLGDARIYDIGLDLGITKEGERFKLWLFEVNTYIAGHIYGLSDAKAHCEYFRYLTDKLNDRIE